MPPMVTNRRMVIAHWAMSPPLSGPRHILTRTSKFARRLVVRSLGGEVRAFSDMIDHMSPLRDACEPLVSLSPAMVAFEYCGSLFAHMKNEEAATGKYLARSRGYSTVVGNCGIGQCVLASGLQEPGGWLDHVKRRNGPPSNITGVAHI